MKVLDTFYSIERLDVAPGMAEAKLRIDENHPIFAGHFPGQPVVPGVAMMQIIRELVERALSKSFLIAEASQLKFLAVIDPKVTAEITASISFEQAGPDVHVSASLKGADIVYFKMKSLFKQTHQ